MGAELRQIKGGPEQNKPGGAEHCENESLKQA